MNDGIEDKILAQISEKLLMKKIEMLTLVEGEDALKTVNIVLQSLLAKGFITAAPVGDGTYAVTQKGMRAAKV